MFLPASLPYIVSLQFEPYRWRPCGVTWDSSRTVVVIKLRRTSALFTLASSCLEVQINMMRLRVRNSEYTKLEEESVGLI